MSHRGFTLIEVLATTLLASLLMLAVMSVITSIARDQKQMDARGNESLVPRRLLAVIREDLENTRELTRQSGQIVLDGFNARDAQANPTHLPSRITYLIRTDGYESWLVREEQHESTDSPAPITLELLLPNIASFDIVSVGRSSTQAGSNDDHRIGNSVALRFTFKGKTASTFAQTLVLK